MQIIKYANHNNMPKKQKHLKLAIPRTMRQTISQYFRQQFANVDIQVNKKMQSYRIHLCRDVDTQIDSKLRDFLMGITAIEKIHDAKSVWTVKKTFEF